MKELQIYMTDKQIEFIKDYSTLKRVGFNEGLRQIVDGYQRNERILANQKAKEAFK